MDLGKRGVGRGIGSRRGDNCSQDVIYERGIN